MSPEAELSVTLGVCFFVCGLLFAEGGAEPVGKQGEPRLGRKEV